MSLNDQQKAGEIINIRTKIRANNAVTTDLNSAILGALSKHGIEVDASIVPDLTIAISNEITKELLDVDLPGGTNCQNT